MEAIEQRHPLPIVSILQARGVRHAWQVGGGNLAAAFRMRGLISEHVILKTAFCPRNLRNQTKTWIASEIHRMGGKKNRYMYLNIFVFFVTFVDD